MEDCAFCRVLCSILILIFASSVVEGQETVVYGNTGTISSPNYPSFYPNSYEMTYRAIFTTPGPQQVHLEVTQHVGFSVSGNCLNDYFTINEGGRRCDGPSFYTENITVPGNVLTVYLYTDIAVHYLGFNITYTVLSPESTSITPTTEVSTTEQPADTNTAAPSPTTPVSATPASRCSQCVCVKEPPPDRQVSVMEAEKQREQEKMLKTAEIVQELSINTRNVSRITRKKISAQDDRVTSLAMGTLTAFICFVPLGFIVFSDLVTAVRHGLKMFLKHKNRDRVQNIRLNPHDQ